MPRWCRFLLVVLFSLSLPLQSYAVASMACDSAHCVTSHRDAQAAAPMAMPMSMPMTMHAHAAAPHHAGACACCPACCACAMLPTLHARLPDSAPGYAAPFPSFTAIPPFLTGGIERPPRSLSV